MKIDKVRFEIITNIGDNQSIKMYFDGELDPGESYTDAMAQLRKIYAEEFEEGTRANYLDRIQELEFEVHQLRNQIYELRRTINPETETKDIYYQNKPGQDVDDMPF